MSPDQPLDTHICAVIIVTRVEYLGIEPETASFRHRPWFGVVEADSGGLMSMMYEWKKRVYLNNTRYSIYSQFLFHRLRNFERSCNRFFHNWNNLIVKRVSHGIRLRIRIGDYKWWFSFKKNLVCVNKISAIYMVFNI